MARTNSGAVSGIIEVDTTIPLTPFIDTASMLIEKVVATATNPDGSAYHNSADLEIIERWLAAHFYATRDPRATYEQASSVAEKVESKTDLGLHNSKYGQAAMILDTSGKLAAYNQSLTKGGVYRDLTLTWLGTEAEEVDVG